VQYDICRWNSSNHPPCNYPCFPFVDLNVTTVTPTTIDTTTETDTSTDTTTDITTDVTTDKVTDQDGQTLCTGVCTPLPTTTLAPTTTVSVPKDCKLNQQDTDALIAPYKAQQGVIDVKYLGLGYCADKCQPQCVTVLTPQYKDYVPTSHTSVCTAPKQGCEDVCICIQLEKGPDTCSGQNFDVMALMDWSSSIETAAPGGVGFQMEKDVLKAFARQLTVSPSDSRMGLIDFNNNARLVFSLTKYTTTTGVVNGIQSAKEIAGSTCIACAFKTSGPIFTTLKRPGVPQIALLVTDGVDNNRLGLNDEAEAAKLRAQGVEVFAIGISKDVNEAALAEYTGNKADHLILVKDFATLAATAGDVAQRIFAAMCNTAMSAAG